MTWCASWRVVTMHLRPKRCIVTNIIYNNMDLVCLQMLWIFCCLFPCHEWNYSCNYSIHDREYHSSTHLRYPHITGRTPLLVDLLLLIYRFRLFRLQSIVTPQRFQRGKADSSAQWSSMKNDVLLVRKELCSESCCLNWKFKIKFSVLLINLVISWFPRVRLCREWVCVLRVRECARGSVTRARARVRPNASRA